MLLGTTLEREGEKRDRRLAGRDAELDADIAVASASTGNSETRIPFRVALRQGKYVSVYIPRPVSRLPRDKVGSKAKWSLLGTILRGHSAENTGSHHPTPLEE